MTSASTSAQNICFTRFLSVNVCYLMNVEHVFGVVMSFGSRIRLLRFS